MSHHVIEDRTRTGLQRFTCYSCNEATLVIQSWMTSSEKLRVMIKFSEQHPIESEEK